MAWKESISSKWGEVGFWIINLVLLVFKPIPMKRFLLVFALMVFISVVGICQTITIKKIELAGEKVIVHYDLEDSNPNNEYQLNLYSSKDNYATALTKVTGDVGGEIKPGTAKKIVWNLLEELGGYKGRLSLEIRGKVYVPFAKIQSFDVTKSYKRGKNLNLNWKAGSTNPVHIELFKGSQRIQGELNHPNNGSYLMSIPGSVKPGKDYRIKITDAKNSEEAVYTGYFKVAPKMPLLLKVLPVLAVGGAVAFLAGGSKGGENPPPDTSIEIVNPPLPGN